MAKYHSRPKPSQVAGEQPPDAELDVLAYLWRCRQATAREVREALHIYRPMAHGSVVTLLKRLQARGLVDKSKGQVGKSFVYRPTNSARPTYKRMVRNIADRIFGGNSLELVSTLFNAKLPTEDELAQMQEMLDKLQSKRRRRRK